MKKEKRKRNGWKTHTWYCPNCGAFMSGVENDKGFVRKTCEVCHATTVLAPVYRRHEMLAVYPPEKDA